VLNGFGFLSFKQIFIEVLDRPIKLSELTENIQQVLEHSFADHRFWVIADVTNHTFKATSSVHYFDLVEKHINSSAIVARMSARAWGLASGKILKFEQESGQRFENNINVLVLVSVNFSGSYGLQLNLHDIDPTYTLGHFERQRKATLDRLVEYNSEFISRIGNEYQSKNKSLRLNMVIQKIAVITSDTSAGFQDFVHTLETNAFSYRFLVQDYFTLVQGEANAKAVIDTLVEIYKSKVDYDAVVIIRGGGAQTDFLIFDDYQLSRAVAKFPIPTITGIGHHKNQTVVDLMANTVTNTPTKAAEFILLHNRQFEEFVLHAQRQLIIKTQQIFLLHNRSLNQLKSSLLRDVFRLLHGHQRILLNLSASVATFPKFILSNKTRNIRSIAAAITGNSREAFIRQQNKLAHFTALVKMMSPQNILNKGFAIVKLQNNIISNAGKIQIGSEIQIEMASEELTAKITSKKRR
jgi:exodeoxyribonuclease VII large subunit